MARPIGFKAGSIVSIDKATMDIKHAINRINSICEVSFLLVVKKLFFLICAKVAYLHIVFICLSFFYQIDKEGTITENLFNII